MRSVSEAACSIGSRGPVGFLPLGRIENRALLG
jgi:hypothetical protein